MATQASMENAEELRQSVKLYCTLKFYPTDKATVSIGLNGEVRVEVKWLEGNASYLNKFFKSLYAAQTFFATENRKLQRMHDVAMTLAYELTKNTTDPKVRDVRDVFLSLLFPEGAVSTPSADTINTRLLALSFVVGKDDELKKTAQGIDDRKKIKAT